MNWKFQRNNECLANEPARIQPAGLWSAAKMGYHPERLYRSGQATRAYSFALLLFLLVPEIGSTQNTQAQSLESGTLIMAARTETAVIIAVDSKISHEQEHGSSLEPTIEGSRKLVDIGKESACAIDSFLGKTRMPETDISESLREWDRNHPKAELSDSVLEELLKAAGEGWDRAHYSIYDLPNKRSIGSEISMLICGGIINGIPSILRGHTFVKYDGTAGYEKLKPSHGGLLYVDGKISGDVLMSLALTPVPGILARTPFASDPDFNSLIALKGELNENAPVMSALRTWWQSGQSFQVGMDSNSSPWTESSIKELFSFVFRSIEASYPDEVGAPNNVRIISTCGRKSSTVEAKGWAICRRGRSSPSRLGRPGFGGLAFAAHGNATPTEGNSYQGTTSLVPKTAAGPH